MNNFLKIMSLEEENIHRVVFVNQRFEGGINFIFEPETQKFEYQIFIHSEFPLSTSTEWKFGSFSEARSFASRHFSTEGWELLEWDNQAKRPCSEGGFECGSGTCEMCKSTGGGCKSCGAQEEKFAV